ncbi:MAG: hypothetical protein OXI15_02335 [Chromatiales bacterium]|nr:hypothetical protein [Chromatiales bacterium]
MQTVRLDPEQVPHGAELLIGAEYGPDAAGRALYEYLPADDHGPGQRIVIGTMRTQRLRISAAADLPPSTAYGAALGRTRESAPRVPIGAPIVVRTDVDDTHGWRLYRVTPLGRALYETWIEHGPPGHPVVDELQAAARANPVEALEPLADPETPDGEAIRQWVEQHNTPRIPPRPAGRAARRRWRRAIARRKAERTDQTARRANP